MPEFCILSCRYHSAWSSSAARGPPVLAILYPYPLDLADDAHAGQVYGAQHTFTPFGFQNERRSVWQAQDVYLKASPFYYADKIKLPLLLVHGEDDANPGTEPFQSRKLYQAIRGNGGITRLVMLPNEPHWYTALESNEQLVSEMLNWFDTYVKNAK